MPLRNYRDLIVWQKAMQLVEHVYRASSNLPKEEIYGLTSQIRRACVSIASNIAEGEGRRSQKEFSRFLSIAHGSLRELETQILIAGRLHYFDSKRVSVLMRETEEVGRLLNGLINSIAKAERRFP